MKFNTKINASSNLATTASIYFYSKSGKIYVSEDNEEKIAHCYFKIEKSVEKHEVFS